MEFWKRSKKAGAPPTPPVNGTHSINPSTISGPIHNMEPQPSNSPFTSGGGGASPRSPVALTAGGPDNNGATFGDAEFRERYKTYRQQRRQSHTSRSSQLTTGSNDGGGDGMYFSSSQQQLPPPPPLQASGTQPSLQSMARHWGHDEVGGFQQQRAPSVVSTASSASGSGLAEGGGGGPPRGSLRSTRSSATGGGGGSGGRPLTGGSGGSADLSLRSTSISGATNRVVSTTSVVGAFPSAATTMGHPPHISEMELGDEEINLMLGRLMDEMDLKDAQRLQIHQMSTPNKLRLLKQHKQFEAFPTDNRGNAPEYFYQSLIGSDIRILPKQTLVHLRVCVSTQPVNWV
ncbi:hypothetical protein GGF42_002254, partial [Coemansia sp. RSA 2424]